MTTRQLAKLRKNGHPFHVKFVASACGPMVIQVCYQQNGEIIEKLIKDIYGEVVACHNLSQAYAVCRSAGVRQAELVQILPHLEVCASSEAKPINPSMTLCF